MTRYIREHGLLPTHEVDAISSEAPCDLIDFQRAAADVPIDERPRLREWIEHFKEGALRLAA